ncbi:MAG: M12 family metallo-peptidase [Phycisphaerales bacterium]|nr:M12 family metallo-peptidase [Phycisphaerales bacterium]
MLPLALALMLCATPAAASRPSPLVAGAGGLELDPGVIATLRDDSKPVVIRNVPLLDGEQADLTVEPFHVVDERTRFVVGASNRPLSRTRPWPVLLRGHLDGLPDSSVYLALGTDTAWGVCDRGDGSGTMLLGHLDDDRLGWTRQAQGALPPLGVPVCRTIGEHRHGTRGVTSDERLSLELAIETDWEYAELFLGDLEDASDYIVALYGAVAAIYDRDVNLDINLTFARLWDTEDDLFNEDDPLSPFREYWNTNMSDVNRDLAQFLTGRTNLPYGGVAWLSATCGGFGYSVSGYILGRFTSPTQPSFGNWDITVSAHELGHNCGTGHTHDYGLDSCAFGETQRGSIMSYCHTTTGGGSNVDMRFHSYTSEKMREHLSDASCLFVDCNDNDIDDVLDIALGMSDDANGDDIPDDCQDCNANGVLDPEDIDAGTSNDADADGRPDECEPDCNGNGLPDDLDIDSGTSLDEFGNFIPDECEQDCNEDGVSDYTEIQADMSLDINRNAELDDCEDCDGDGVPDLEQMMGRSTIWIAGNADGIAKSFHPFSGVPMTSSASGVVDETGELVISPDGRIMMADLNDDRVVEIDPLSGTVIGDFITPGAGGLVAPRGMTWGPDSRFYVATDNQVLAYDGSSGSFDSVHVSPGSGGLADARGLLFTAAGQLLVGTDNGQVFEFAEETGAFQRIVVTDPVNIGGAHGLLVRPSGTLLVSSTLTNSILEYDMTDGTPLGPWDRGGLASGYWGLQAPRTLRLAPDGDVYVATAEGNTSIQVYDEATGLFKRRFYVLSQLLDEATGFDFMPNADIDCNGNLIPDSCDIADGTEDDLDGNGIPDSCSCPGDITGDGTIDVNDVLQILAAWETPDGDVNGDGQTNVDDILVVLAAWNNC